MKRFALDTEFIDTSSACNWRMAVGLDPHTLSDTYRFQGGDAP